jgi:hypothetical protein
VTSELVDVVDWPIVFAHERHMIVTVELPGHDHFDELRERDVFQHLPIRAPHVRGGRTGDRLDQGNYIGVGDDGARRPHALDGVPHTPLDVLRQAAGIACPTDELAEPCRDLGRIPAFEGHERRRELARGTRAPQRIAR